MNVLYKIFCLLFAISLSTLAQASDMNAEIAHLVHFVETTACQYERNGDMHNGQEAAAHIRKKYHYYQDEIDSSERFIELSASKSTMSGKYYMIHCPGVASQKSQQWLLQELQRFRMAKDKPE